MAQYFWMTYGIIGIVVAAIVLSHGVSVDDGKYTRGVRLTGSALVALLVVMAWPVAVGMMIGNRRRM